MPPFKDGLLKRKLDSSGSKATTEKDTSKEESEPASDEELIRGPLDTADDSDSDYEPASGAHSDQEQDEVLFDDDVDSTLGDEDLSENASDNSSELTDSEDADSEQSGENDSDNEQSAEGSDESTDSGAESGVGQAQSSDETDSKMERAHKDKQKQKKNRNAITDTSEQQEKTSVDLLTDQIRETSVNIQPVSRRDEYSSGDSSDEEDRVNTAGAVPAWWYQEYPHVGYDLDGRRLLRPPQRDRLDDFLRKCEDPDFWRTVRDPSTGQDVRLSADDLRLLHRLRQGLTATADQDEYQPWVEWFSRSVLATPLRAFPDHKRSFLPSRSDQRQIAKIVHALKMGWAKTRKQIADERRKNKEKKFYDLWGAARSDEEQARGLRRHIPAPRRPPPAHAESYNPPPEYLLDRREMKEWNKLSETPWKRKYTFLPQRFSSLRAVPAYERFTRERFLRCLDLYLAPRAIKMRLTISPEQLVPVLPSPRELQPFPTTESLVLRGHEGCVRSVDFDPSGQYIVSGSDDGTLKVWETSTGRCLRTVRLAAEEGAGEGEGEEAGVACVSWCGARGLSLLAAAAGRRLLFVSPGAGVGDHRVGDHTDRLLREAPPAAPVEERTASVARWEPVTDEQWARGVRLAVRHFRPVTHMSWHARGDYVCVTLREPGARAVVVHQVSRRASQLPLARAKGLVQCAVFHPSRPLLFVATQRVVRVYDLVKQELVRKLQTGAQWISALAVHPAGDNLLVASYDRKCMWFDLELSSRPYQTLRLHGAAVRTVSFSARYPLFASGGDDRVVVSHGMVYGDLLQNPLLVPLKQLAGGERRGELCVLALRWHPAQPWLLAACADHSLRLYS